MLSSQSREFHNLFCAINCCSHGFSGIFFRKINFLEISRKILEQITIFNQGFQRTKTLAKNWKNIRFISRKNFVRWKPQLKFVICPLSSFHSIFPLLHILLSLYLTSIPTFPFQPFHSFLSLPTLPCIPFPSNPSILSFPFLSFPTYPFRPTFPSNFPLPTLTYQLLLSFPSKSSSSQPSNLPFPVPQLQPSFQPSLPSPTAPTLLPVCLSIL